MGVLLISHGKLAAGIYDSCRMIIGDNMEMQQVEYISLNPGEDIEKIRQLAIETISKLLTIEPQVIILVDIFGASPFNIAMYAVQQLKLTASQAQIITGMNLAMLIEALTAEKDSDNLSKLSDIIISNGKDDIQIVPLVAKQEDNEDDY